MLQQVLGGLHVFERVGIPVQGKKPDDLFDADTVVLSPAICLSKVFHPAQNGSDNGAEKTA